MSWLKQNAVAPALLKPHGIPKRYAQFELENIANKGIHVACSEYLRKADSVAANGIAPAFFGRGGSYKTLGAAVIARMLYDVGHVQVAFLSCRVDLPRLERDRFDPATDKAFRLYASVPFLVVDDFDAAAQGTWQADRLGEIAEARYAAILPTLWTANLTVSKTDQSSIVNKYGQAFARRLWESSEGFRVMVR